MDGLDFYWESFFGVWGGCQIFGDFWNLREILFFEKFRVQIIFVKFSRYNSYKKSPNIRTRKFIFISRNSKKNQKIPKSNLATLLQRESCSIKKNNQEEQILDISIPNIHVFLLVNRKLKNVCSFHSNKYKNSHLQKLQLFVPFSHLIFLLY